MILSDTVILLNAIGLGAECWGERTNGQAGPAMTTLEQYWKTYTMVKTGTMTQKRIKTTAASTGTGRMMNPFQGRRKMLMSRHTLPVKWDGNPIIWDTWTPTDVIIICGDGYREKPYRCPHCKTRVHQRSITGEVLADPMISLVLYRCMTCRYTTIMSLATVPG